MGWWKHIKTYNKLLSSAVTCTLENISLIYTPPVTIRKFKNYNPAASNAIEVNSAKSARGPSRDMRSRAHSQHCYDSLKLRRPRARARTKFSPRLRRDARAIKLSYIPKPKKAPRRMKFYFRAERAI